MNKSHLHISTLALFILWSLQSCTKSKSSNYVAINGDKQLPEIVDFNFHIKPILSDRCFKCHGPDENARKAGLRFDIEKEAFSKIEATGGYAIVKGKPHKSKMMKRLLADDPELQMPPPNSNLSISEYEIALIEKWINQGAEWKTHWSFIPPVKLELPTIENTNWAKNEIDYFVLEKIEKEGFTPSKKASKEKLIRRVTFDITGLPPTLNQINAFLKDSSANAFEKVVNRLLESPHYGERMASEWLDVARYADTHGYQTDSHRRMWPWRDWVIEAFNKNMPYNQFIEWQLAGDLLNNPTREQLIATGFNRNHMITGETGVIDEEFRVEYVADRTNTTGKALLGITMECARCHDHKYDPISQKEYFNFFAFYNNVDEMGLAVNWAESYPAIMLTTKQQDKTIDSLDQSIATQNQQLEAYIEELRLNESYKTNKDKVKINIANGLVDYLTFDELIGENKFKNKANSKRHAIVEDATTLIEGIKKKAIAFDGNVSVNLGADAGNFDSNEEFSFAFWTKFPEPAKRAGLFHKLEYEFLGGKGYHLFIDGEHLSFQMNNAWDHNYIKVTTKEKFPFEKWTHITVSFDGTSKANGVALYLNGEQMPLKISNDNLTKSITCWGMLKVGSANLAGGSMDDFRVYNRKLTQPEVSTLANKTITTNSWFEFNLINKDKRYKASKKAISSLLGTRIKTIEKVPMFMVMQNLKDSVRPTYILNRGAYDDRGEEVGIGTPKAILGFDKNLPKNRLGLSKWLFAKKHPLTSRVMVNRLWQTIFGRGIVSTSDDFGSQGSLLTHPELLDWLAIEFRENDWDIKHMIKTMVLSATYQQASKITLKALEKDKYNLFLARGTRYRMSAEMIRDNALAVSKLLVKDLGGPSVKPYQPKGLWSEISTLSSFKYLQSHGDSLYRRSLYTYWRRTTPPPSMITFDSSTRNFCVVKRQATSTPLQALVLLNDVQFVEAARVFAERVLREGGNNIEEKLVYAFRLATARKPNDNEINELKKLYSESFTEFKKHPNDANKLLHFGEYPIDKKLNSIEVAAYTVVTSALLNLDETITKS